MVRLESQGTILDLFRDESIKLDINVQNVRDIGRVYAPISKTFTLPASDRNNEFFKHYWDVNVSGGFDAYSRTDCQLYVDSEQIFSGYLELIDCVIENSEPKQYEVLVASATPSLAKTLEGKTLDDLQISSISDSTYNRTQIVNSWAGGLAGGDIRYGLIGQEILVNSNGKLLGYSTNAGDASRPFRVSDFYPYMRLSTIIKAIIEENGFRYSSNWLDNDTRLAKTYLLLGSKGGTLNDIDIFNARVIDVSGSTTISAIGKTTGIDPEAGFKQITFPSEQEDPNNNWNTSNSSYTAPANGQYKFNFSATVSNTNQLEIVAFDRADVTGGCDPLNGVGCNPIGNFIYTMAAASASDLTVNANLAWTFQSGKEYVFYIRCKSPSDTTDVTDRELKTIAVPLSPEGASINFASLLPEYSQKDFLGQVAKMYNLVFIPDRVDDKLLTIEPWSDWITSGSTFDLTPYVDQNKPINVKPTTELQGRELAFLMELGDTEFGERYNEQFGIPAGSIEVKDTGNEFAQGENKVETEFIYTLMQRDQSSLVQWAQLTDENYEPVDIGLRLGMWNGVANYSYDWLDASGSVTNYPSGTIGFLPPYDATSPTSSDFSLGFTAITPEGLDVPINNLFTEYWAEYINNIYDKDSRLVSLEAKLDSHVLNGIALNDLVLYKNQYYLIQSIQYDTMSERAKFELLKAEATSPVICNLTPTDYNFRGLVTFEDADGNSTTSATRNCCEFFGFRYSRGKCYSKFDVKPPIGLANPILNVPSDNGLGQVTGILDADLLVPSLNPTDGTVTYRTVNNIISNSYGDPIYDDSNAELSSGGIISIAYSNRQVNLYKIGRLCTLNFVIDVSSVSTSGNVQVVLDLSSVLPSGFEFYDDGASPPQPLGSAMFFSSSGAGDLPMLAYRFSNTEVYFNYPLTSGSRVLDTTNLTSPCTVEGSITYIAAE